MHEYRDAWVATARDAFHDALQQARRAEVAEWNADSALSQYLRAYGTGWAAAQGWLYQMQTEWPS
jgi:hypothetical protein